MCSNIKSEGVVRSLVMVDMLGIVVFVENKNKKFYLSVFNVFTTPSKRYLSDSQVFISTICDF